MRTSGSCMQPLRPDRRILRLREPLPTNIPGDLVPIRGARPTGRPDDREFIMSKEKQENDQPAALGMIEKLCQRYPKTFTHEPHDVRPLARGIPKAIVADATDLPASIVSQALAIYAAWLPYMGACIAGAPRIDLIGDPAGVVTRRKRCTQFNGWQHKNASATELSARPLSEKLKRLGNDRVKPQGAGHDPSRARPSPSSRSSSLPRPRPSNESLPKPRLQPPNRQLLRAKSRLPSRARPQPGKTPPRPGPSALASPA